METQRLEPYSKDAVDVMVIRTYTTVRDFGQSWRSAEWSVASENQSHSMVRRAAALEIKSGAFGRNLAIR